MTYKFANEKIVTVDLDNIVPCFARNLEAFPLEASRLEALDASMKSDEIWTRIRGRFLPDGKFEQATGHHLVALMRKEGMKTTPVLASDLDDAAMIRVMTNDNGDGRAQSDATIQNAVWAARAHIESAMLQPLIDQAEGVLVCPADLAGTQPQAGTVEIIGTDHGSLVRILNGWNNGNGLQIGAGEEMIEKFFDDTISQKQVRKALKALPQSDWTQTRIADLQKVWAKAEAKAAKAKAESEKAKAAQKEAQKAAATAKKAEQRAKDKAEKDASDKAAAAAHKKALEKRQAAQAKAEEAAKVKAAADAKAKADAKAVAAAEKAKKEADYAAAKASSFDYSSLEVFDSAGHAGKFKDACLAHWSMNPHLNKAVPVGEQADLAKEIVDALDPRSTTDGGKKSGIWVTYRLNEEMIEARVAERKHSHIPHYWDMPRSAWRKSLVRLMENIGDAEKVAKLTGGTLGNETTIKRDEVPSLMRDFFASYGFCAKDGPLEVVKGGGKLIEDAPESAFSAYVQGIDAKRKNAAKHKDEVLASAMKQVDRYKDGLEEARLALIALKKIVQKDGLSLPTQGFRDQLGNVNSSLGFLESALGVTTDTADAVEVVQAPLAIDGEIIEDAEIVG